MNADGAEQVFFEIGVVVPKRNHEHENEIYDCVEVLVDEFTKMGLKVERVHGLTEEFIKLGAPVEVLGRAAANLQIVKPTSIGMDLQFEWENVDAFLRQPDGSLFSWCERFQCYYHLIYGTINRSKSDINLTFDGKEIQWEAGKSLLHKLESEGIVKQVFPLHDEKKRKNLLRSWALKLKDCTNQPIDDIYSYFGVKIAVYFTFLGMYTRWITFPAAFGLIVDWVNFGSLQLLVLPIFFVSIVLWAVMFFQFWKRKNAALLARLQINSSVSASQESRVLGMEWSALHSSIGLTKNLGTDKAKLKEAFQRYEWFGYLMRFRNDTIVILSIICLQLPFELCYAHLYAVIKSHIVRFGLTAIYISLIQYFTKIGGKISVRLIKYEIGESQEYRADSLVYKVFGLYFMQTYIGVFYHALVHRDFLTLRLLLIQRMIISQVKLFLKVRKVFENLVENSLPFLKYSYKKFKAVRNEEQCGKGGSTGKVKFSSRVEKEYLKSTYSASICKELEDGLFDDFLELALQFGMIMMFACAFPSAFVFSAMGNLVEMRADALKLLVMFKRPVPRAATTIGAWLNIFQFLIMMSICTNSALLVWFYDQEGKWKIEPGLAAILIMEHVLLLIKFGFSHLVPEEPAWVRANRMKNVTQAQYMCSRQLFSGGEKAFAEWNAERSLHESKKTD
ncbi:hypothetical protein SLE2022_309560 [Rubroshorea leprosula]